MCTFTAVCGGYPIKKSTAPNSLCMLCAKNNRKSRFICTPFQNLKLSVGWKSLKHFSKRSDPWLCNFSVFRFIFNILYGTGFVDVTVVVVHTCRAQHTICSNDQTYRNHVYYLFRAKAPEWKETPQKGSWVRVWLCSMRQCRLEEKRKEKKWATWWFSHLRQQTRTKAALCFYFRCRRYARIHVLACLVSIISCVRLHRVLYVILHS